MRRAWKFCLFKVCLAQNKKQYDNQINNQNFGARWFMILAFGRFARATFKKSKSTSADCMQQYLTLEKIQDVVLQIWTYDSLVGPR